MMKMRYIMTFVLVCAACCAVAQPIVQFSEQRHDFGTFAEEVGTVSCDFEFVNTGTEPLVIKNVRASCGCTATEYSQEPVAPGDSGVVKVTYNAEGRPGKFSKAIYVYTNTTPERSVLRIIGEVISGDHPDSPRYAYKIGSLKLKSLHVALETVVKGRSADGSVEVINASADTIVPTPARVPQHLRVKFLPDTLLPYEKGTMVVTFDADAIDDWGYRRDEFVLTETGGEEKVEPEYNTITVSGTITEDFTKMTAAEREQAPILVVGESNIDFKVIEGTKRVSRTIYVVNVGRTPLTIHKVRNENNILKAKVKKSKLKPGQSTELVVEVDPMRAKSNLLLSDIYIVSNDPNNTSQPIRVTAEFR